MVIKTKRLKIIPLTTEQVGLLVIGQDVLEKSMGLALSESHRDYHLQTAFEEMYRQCTEHPKRYFWYTNWQIILKSENKSIGSIGFLGEPNKSGEVEIGYGIDIAYRNKGYATEAVKGLCKWAFDKGKVNYIRARTELENGPSRSLLEKCKFKLKGEDEACFIYEIERPRTFWIVIYMCLGTSIGMPMGLSAEGIVLGIFIGMILGGSIGVLLDNQDKRSRIRSKYNDI